MKRVRLLVIGDSGIEDRLGEYFRARDIELVVTKLAREEEYDESHERYIPSTRGMQLLRHATAALYDAIIIGNNGGLGRTYAAVVPKPMRPKTMIVWNEFRPGSERVYVQLEFRAFGNRYRLTPDPEEFTAADFIAQVAAQLS